MRIMLNLGLSTHGVLMSFPLSKVTNLSVTMEFGKEVSLSPLVTPKELVLLGFFPSLGIIGAAG